MTSKLYVGNLPFSVTEDQIRELFSQVGEVDSVKIITDRETGRSRGFCFVEMDNADEAISALNGKDFGGRNLTVSEAREKENKQYSRPNHGGYKKRFNSR
ncbi:MAG TPA: RNA-binding protein [Chitinispirillaceae bacterium]|nr:RNA-binding protein [Chitinispirillaceae bacterium]